MSRFFEIAYKTNNGSKIKNEDGEFVKWDVDEKHMPKYATERAAGADFCAAEDVTVKSIWKSVGEYLNSRRKDITYCIEYHLKHGNNIDAKLLEDMHNDDRKLFAPTIIHTGIKAKMEDDEVLTIYNRSSGPKKLGFILANSAGIIDADYYGCDETDGEIMFAYYNILPFDVKVHKGDKIGQGVFSKILRAENSTVGGKRLGGFGSTGKL